MGQFALTIRIKRVYDRPEPEDGTRILVDRIWPRGVRKAAFGPGEWMRSVAPSSELRKWFDHDPAKWTEFERRYREELRENPEEVEKLRELAREGTLTLCYSARDERHNQAVALRDYLLGP